MLLDFEKPIAELEAKLNDMKSLASDSDEKVQEAIRALEQKIIQLKKETFENLTGWQRVQLSRHPDRPYTLDYIYEITTDFIELHGDRQVADDKAMVGGLGTIEGQTFMLIGQQKGRTTKQRQMRNFGMANPEGYRKALRLMRIAEKFGKPIVSSSANESGKPTPLYYKLITKEIVEGADYVVRINQNSFHSVKPSTIIRITGDFAFEIVRV
mgnify:CR=1 FL=1